MTEQEKPAEGGGRDIDRLVDEHADALYRYAVMRVGKPDAAEDIVQDTLLAALQGWESFQGKSSERTWLIGILRHKILDFFRKGANRDLPDDQSWRQQYFDRARHWADKMRPWSGDPADLAENSEFLQVLRDCLAALSQLMARAFIMREMEGLSGEEVCKQLEISETNLWVRLHRARLQLRRCLDRNWFA